jgi:predicted flavoprotein YhiN
VQAYAGQPFKSVALNFVDHQGRRFARKGEFVATGTGVEGSLIYAVSALLRDDIEATGRATFMLTCCPTGQQSAWQRWPTRGARVHCPATSRAAWGWRASSSLCCTSC